MKITKFIALGAILFLICQPLKSTINSKKLVLEQVNQTLLLDLVNTQRAKGCKCGNVSYPSAKPVKWNEKLAMAASKHSKDMKTKNYFSHTSQDGTSFSDRIKREGYSWSACAENISKGYYSEKDVIAGWVKSPAHCKNLMGKTYTEMGVGREGEYWTQTFATQ